MSELRPIIDILNATRQFQDAESKRKADEYEAECQELEIAASEIMGGILSEHGIDPASVEMRAGKRSNKGVDIYAEIPGMVPCNPAYIEVCKDQSGGTNVYWASDMIRHLTTPSNWHPAPKDEPKPEPEPEPDTPRCPFALFREECGDTCPIYNHQVGMCSVAVLALKIGQDVVREERA